MARVHIIGGGLAGLAAAVRLAGTGRAVTVYEATDHAGGRARSFFDDSLGTVIDNGNHLLLGANTETFAYLERIGARDTLESPPRAAFPFFDLRSGARWCVRPNRGPIPWWLLSPSTRIPGTVLRDYLGILRVARAGREKTLAECVAPGSAIMERFWEPLCAAVLNTDVDEAAARLLWTVIRASFARGEAASRPHMARHGLSASFVDPALASLARAGVRVEFNHRLRGLDFDGDRLRTLDLTRGRIELDPGDRAILAVPHGAASELVPGLVAPIESRAIVNGHFRLPRPASLPEGSFLLGLIGGLSHWLFLRGDIASVTISAADAIVDDPAESLALRMWPEIARALGIAATELPRYRIVKEKRATFAQTPAALARRPGVASAYSNLYLAGDWTATGLPATIEGAIRSGHRAAERLLASR